MNCKICDKYFSGIAPFREHEASEKHKKKVMLSKLFGFNSSRLESQSSEILKTEVACCSPCSKTFSNLSDFAHHAMSEEHALMIINRSQEKFEDGLIAENSLSMEVESSKDELTDSISESPSAKGLFTESNPVPWYSKCETCSKNFSGPEPYQQHIDSAAHIKKLANLSNTPASLSANSSLLVCKLCDKYFSGPESYEQHMISKGHQKKVLSGSSFMTTLRCDTCDKIFTGPAQLDLHLNSETHKKVFERHQLLTKMGEGKENVCVDSPSEKISLVSSNQLSPWYCEICQVNCSGPEPFKEHIVSKKHAKKAIAQGKEGKQETLLKLFGGDSNNSLQQPEHCSASTLQTKTDDSNVGASKMVVNDLGDKIQSSIFGNSSYIKNITPSNLDISVFKVDESINFDKNSAIHIEGSVLDMCEKEDDHDINDELVLDDEDSP